MTRLHDDSSQPAPTPAGEEKQSPTAAAAAAPHVRSLRDVEVEHVRYALRVSGGNKVRAARSLGISRDTLYRKISEFGLATTLPAAPEKRPRRSPR